MIGFPWSIQSLIRSCDLAPGLSATAYSRSVEADGFSDCGNMFGVHVPPVERQSEMSAGKMMRDHMLLINLLISYANGV